jgi:hypothetical protein
MDREQRERVSAEPQDEHLRRDHPRDEDKGVEARRRGGPSAALISTFTSAPHIPPANPLHAREASPPRADAPLVTAEPALRALLSQAINDRDVPRLQERKAALLALFQAIPTAERDPLRARLHDPKDTLGHLFQTALSTRLRAQLFATLDSAMIPAPVGADSVEMSAFAATLQPARFHPTTEVVLDGAWRTSQTVAIVAVPGVGPPADEPGPRVHWRLMDRMGERSAGGMVTWLPGHGAPPAIQVTIDQPGRWTVAIEFVDRGQVIAAIETPIRARSASERGDDLPMLLGGNQLATSAEAMSDPQIGAQLGMLRTQLGKPPLGSRRPDDPTYRRLAPAIEELQWQQHQRGLPAGSEPTPSFEARRFDASTPGRRAAIQQAIDALIGRHGIEGARAQLHDLVVPPPGTGQGAGAEPAAWDPHASEIERALQAELALRSAEAASFLARFDHQGRAIALGLLAESETRLRAEFQRYGLTQAPAQTGGYGGQGSAGSDVTALRDAIDQGKTIRAAHDRLLQAAQDHAAGGAAILVERARQEFEATKQLAVGKHPMLRVFLEGEARRGMSAPAGSVPGPLDLGRYEPGALAPLMGWELNKKLGDLQATRDHITDGSLSIFGVPRVVELVKANLHVAPGSVHDGIVNERAAHVSVHPVSDVLARVRSLNREDLRDAEALLPLCADDRFVLSAIAPNKTHR